VKLFKKSLNFVCGHEQYVTDADNRDELLLNPEHYFNNVPKSVPLGAFVLKPLDLVCTESIVGQIK